MYGPSNKTEMEKEVWKRLTELGYRDRVIDYIDEETTQVIEQGYDVYPADVVDRAIKAGLERAGVKQDTEFNSGEVVALSYLFGILLAHGILKHQAKSVLSTTGS
jgi:hypothetical protein